MAQVIKLPCDVDGVCMSCKTTPQHYEIVLCDTCVTPWHKECVLYHPGTLAPAYRWECPDCCQPYDPTPVTAVPKSAPTDDLIAAVRAIEADGSLSDGEKARRRQDLMTRGKDLVTDPEASETKGKGRGNDVFELFDETFNCSFCMQLPERPVTLNVSVFERSDVLLEFLALGFATLVSVWIACGTLVVYKGICDDRSR